MSKNKERKNSPYSENSESEYRSSDESDREFMELDFLLFNRPSMPNEEVSEKESRDIRHDISENSPSTDLDECVSEKPTIHDTRDDCENEVRDSTVNIAANMERVTEIPLRTVHYPEQQESIENTEDRSTLLEEINKTFASPTLKDVYECRLCKKKLSSKSNLNRHMKIHNEEKPFKCDHCNFTCKRKEGLSEHMKTHSNDKPFKCNRCNFSSRRKDYLRLHINTHSIENTFKCDRCNIAFKRKYCLSQHLNTHSNEKQFKCDRCDFTSKWNGNLRFHIKTKHESKLESNQKKDKK